MDSNSQTSGSHVTRRVKDEIDFEEDPHRAALEDNPEEVHVSASTWAAIFFLAISFGPPLGLGFVTMASVLTPVTAELGGSSSDLVWVMGSSSLASAVSFSLAGPMSDVFGRRIPMLAGQLFTVIGCITAATAQSMRALIAGETLLGVAIGIIFVAYAGVPEMLPNKWRSLGMGILEAGLAVPWSMVSAILGNSLQEYATWRWIFYIGLIVEVVGLAGTAVFYRPTSRPRGDFEKTRWAQLKGIDSIGLSLFTAGLTVFLIGLTWGGSAPHPWASGSTVAPLVVGFIVFLGAFAYDFAVAENPLFPRTLFAMFRQFSLLLVVLFISGMNFYSMATLLPEGSLYMFTTSGIQIGVMALPNNILQVVFGALVPMFAHKIGFIKYQLIFALVLQAVFIAATAGAVYPNEKWAYMFLPAFGVPMFVWITVLSYSIASLHVPHSRLGVAMGLLGTFRATGGAVGNAVFGTIFNNRATSYLASSVTEAALSEGFEVSNLSEIIPAAIEYNLGVKQPLQRIPGMTVASEEILHMAVRSAYGHAFKIVFYITIPFGILALFCALFVEDPTMYMTNHIQSAMSSRKHNAASEESVAEEKGSVEASSEENSIYVVHAK